jgi:hypothetical protein
LGRGKTTDTFWSGSFILAMAAGQAECSHLAEIGLFGYFVFADSKRAGNDRASALVTRVSREVQVLFSH